MNPTTPGCDDKCVHVQSVLSQAQGSGPVGALVFVAAYAVATVVLVPASVLTLGAGAVYGAGKGTALVSVASTMGCTAAFLVSRYVARPFVERRLEGNRIFQNVQRKIPERGAQLVFLLRLTPTVPFTLLNYMCGTLHRSCIERLS
jgi:uncharacterized membrane protein YdjX (TVP38/TMEM64 family)